MFLLFAGLLLIFGGILSKSGRYTKNLKRVAIVVLGDIGRSPRMQYHAISLASNGFHVDVIGYAGAKAHDEFVNNSKIKEHHIYQLAKLPAGKHRIVYLLYAVCKVIFQIAQLCWHLLAVIPKPSHVLIQNPPAIPTLFVAHVCCFLRGCRLVIDWHNYGWSILALSLPRNGPIVKIAKWYEDVLAHGAYASFCVTDAMRQDLKARLGVESKTLYDRPPSRFKVLSLEEKHETFVHLGSQLPGVMSDLTCDASRTLFTQRSPQGRVTWRKDRPVLLVSSTSWTEDEDFGVLLQALQEYSQAAKANNLPSILCLITGRGPLRNYYEEKIRAMPLYKVTIATVWLAAEDYPKLLGVADLGISLHLSSSGLDLPMKVVDMFGCGLPVCAWGFPCLKELVTEGENGLVFNSANELSKQFQTLLKNFDAEESQLSLLAKGANASSKRRWDTNWNEIALPVFKD
eukprot:Colp12_sorted_trinity150504_noHs@19984